jgi:tetratricopeptide (TPR) repeat protein
MRRVALGVVVCLLVAELSFAHHIKQGASRAMPVTTSSPKARALFEQGMQDYENLHLERANEKWRAASKADPNFALAYAWIAFNGRDPAEASAARRHAKALTEKTSPGEKLMIQWIVSVQENNTLAGIAAMNDMLEMYSKDRRLYYLVGNWMMGVNGYRQAQKMFERALAIDKNYAAALNDVAYCFAHDRDFGKAFGAMERYIALLPKEPNPQDSYGEISRMSGNYDAALEHYQDALKIDPGFISSQLGIADTYALMGDEPRARAEYDRAIQSAPTAADKADYLLQRAASWVREKNYAEADKAFAETATMAAAQGLDLEEAQAHRMAGMYQADDAVALKHLEEAEQALAHKGNATEADMLQEKAIILRYRAVRADHAGNAEVAAKTLQQLETIAGGSRSYIVQGAYHGALGATLMRKEKTDEAIPHLEEDQENPFSLELLARAYQLRGDSEKRHEAEVKLRSMNVPTVEQAMVVPEVRAQRPSGE